MTWKEMHIGIDIGLRVSNSALYNKLLPEEKDFMLNNTIERLINLALPTNENQLNIVDDDAIKSQYAILDAISVTKEFESFTSKGGYIEVDLPKNFEGLINKGMLEAGYEYEIVTPGATNLGEFGVINNIGEIGDKFTYTPDDIIFGYEGSAFQLTMSIGYRYKILRADGLDFTSYGASSNDVGTIFVCTVNHSFVNPTMKESRLQVLAGTPIWDNQTTLKYAKSYDVFRFIKSTSLIHTDCNFGNGSIRKGYYYTITKAGTIVGLTNFGSEYDKVEVGYTFLCTKDGIPAWGASGVRMSEYVASINRLPAIKDVDNILDHAYGTTHSSPITSLWGGKLRVYHNNKFAIKRVIVDYVRTPIRINSVTNTDCDLNRSVHGLVVDKTVSYLAATTGTPTYNALKNEEGKI